MPETGLAQEDVTRVLRAVALLLRKEELQDGLRDDEHFPESLRKMEMPESARGPLLSILSSVDLLKPSERRL
jgi:hypothetical protein